MRSLTNGFKTATAQREVYIGALVEIDYPTTPVRAWTGVGSIVWDSKTWAGLGDMGEMSAVQERAGAEAGRVTLKMAGITAYDRARALLNTSASRKVNCWLAAFSVDAGTGAWSVLPDPWKFFSGISDVHKLHKGAIEVSVETVLSRLKYAKVARFSNEEQQRHFPGDRSMEYASRINNQPRYWGSPTPINPTIGGPGYDNGGGVYVLE